MSGMDEHAAVKEECQKDTYCYICEDGGDIIDCSWCSNSCCYNVIGKKLDNPANEQEACVSIPESMITADDTLFPCPKCVADRGLSAIGYFINRGARATTRVVSRTSVAIIIYHLHSYTALAKSLSEQLNAALSAFYVPVACQTRLIHRGFTSGEAELMFEEIPRTSPYHLAVIFLTEGDPQGGWWHTINYGSQKDTQVSEEDFLGTCLSNLKRMARGAMTARVFGVACGFNLRVKGVIGAIVEFLEKTPFGSLVMPSTCSLLPCEYLTIFPEIFVNLYYLGASLDTSLYRTWGKSKAARTHTGMIIMDRPNGEPNMSVRMVLYAPVISRPLGVPLPVVAAICGCPEDGAEWVYKTELSNAPEVIFIYRSKCCRLELQVGIYPDQRRQIKQHEVLFMVEQWNRGKGRFSFNESQNVCMKILPPNLDGKPSPVDMNEMWTRSGKRAKKREMGLVMAKQ
ncbi:hypothetical protein FRC11_014255 [Ceratobasidium sp. 423]|nr:hypothetical protein FRC11_014255 [Ceratobasidium sp. 423]